MAKKILILAGAPERKSVETESVGLIDHFSTPFDYFISTEKPSVPAPFEADPQPSLDAVLWRSIPLRKARLATGFSQVHELEDAWRAEPEFFTTASPFSQATAETSVMEPASQSILDDFYDYSLAMHEDIPSSQLPPGTHSTDVVSSHSTEGISFDASIEVPPSLDRRLRVPEVAYLSDLEDIPNASFLRSISPQTMTVNLIVGIISIAEPRTVKTRWGSTKSLVELLVGDETKAGFTITFWLSSDPNSKKADGESTENGLWDLRRQDVILLRNVALSSFMGKVHGHSLRKGLTKVDLLWRRKIDKYDRGGLYNIRDFSSSKSAHPQLVKTRRVWEWTVNFVGEGGTIPGKRKVEGRTLRGWEMPPVDTPQDAS